MKASTTRKGFSASDLESDGIQTIIRMRKEGASLARIGVMLNVTPQNVEYLVEQISAIHGRKVFKPNTRFWSPKEVAQKFKVPLRLILRICASGEIACKRSAARNDKSPFLIDGVAMKQLRQHPEIRHRISRKCPICKKRFHSNGTASTVCSADCRKAKRKRLRKVRRRKQKSFARSTVL